MPAKIDPPPPPLSVKDLDRHTVLHRKPRDLMTADETAELAALRSRAIVGVEGETPAFDKDGKLVTRDRINLRMPTRREHDDRDPSKIKPGDNES